MKLAVTATFTNTTVTTANNNNTNIAPSTSNSNDDDWVNVTDKSDCAASKVFTFALSKGPGVLQISNTDRELAAVENCLSDAVVDSTIKIGNTYARIKVQMKMPFFEEGPCLLTGGMLEFCKFLAILIVTGLDKMLQ